MYVNLISNTLITCVNSAQNSVYQAAQGDKNFGETSITKWKRQTDIMSGRVGLKWNPLTLYFNEMYTFSRYRESKIEVNHRPKPQRSSAFHLQHILIASLFSPRWHQAQILFYCQLFPD